MLSIQRSKFEVVAPKEEEDLLKLKQHLEKRKKPLIHDMTMGKDLMGQLKIEMFHVFGLFGTLSFKYQIFRMQFLQKIVASYELHEEAEIAI